MSNDRPQHIDATGTAARQAIAPGVTRYVLAISFALAVIAMVVGFLVA
jgi:hypothetical protein